MGKKRDRLPPSLAEAGHFRADGATYEKRSRRCRLGKCRVKIEDFKLPRAIPAGRSLGYNAIEVPSVSRSIDRP